MTPCFFILEITFFLNYNYCAISNAVGEGVQLILPCSNWRAAICDVSTYKGCCWDISILLNWVLVAGYLGSYKKDHGSVKFIHRL